MIVGTRGIFRASFQDPLMVVFDILPDYYDNREDLQY